ncbi:hypothetical protein [Cryobacterium shii]|uniref:Uncharacterized protein n=1 Tax=Cryobacterium shii TaxID=1259235 RepID=A0AAQ2HG01_9MICO|nr:hypothetical protein [Cryobacterium shii]TFC48904.1 hypothetical protein E3O49_06755 [Cryobacterium shii]
MQRTAAPYLGTRDVVQAQVDTAGEFRQGGEIRTPIRCSLETSSDFSFVATLECSLAEQLVVLGLPGGLASAVIWEVLAEPSVAMARMDHGVHSFRQAVVIARDGSAAPLEIRAVVDAVISPREQRPGQQRTPPVVESASVSIELFDLSEDKETARLLRELMDWCSEFPAPLSDKRSRPDQMAFIGDPRRVGVEAVPDSWRLHLSVLAGMFSLTAAVKDGPSFDGALPSKTTLVVKLDPYAGKTLAIPSGTETLLVDARGRTFASLVDDISLHLVKREAASMDAETAAVARDLRPGERVYHRKIGSSQSFDRFNVGSPKPCSHGEAGFIPWRGPKATKGLERRYTNFKPSMHRHCNKYPTCGMYAVFA